MATRGNNLTANSQNDSKSNPPSFLPARFTNDIYEMTGYRPGMYWQLMWRFVGPILMSAILLTSILEMVVKGPKYGAYDAEQAKVVQTDFPGWVLGIALFMIVASIAPMPLTFLLRRFQILKVDLDIHQGSIRRNETTTSTKVMMDDDDVSYLIAFILY